MWWRTRRRLGELIIDNGQLTIDIEVGGYLFFKDR